MNTFFRMSFILISCVAAGASQESRSLVLARKSEMSIQNLPMPSNAGWARSAATLGYVAAPLVLISGIVADGAGSFSTGIAVGATGTVILAVAVPVISAGGSSARRNSSAEGMPGMRMAGWVTYGLALADATTLIALAANDVDVPGVPISVGAIGAFSILAVSLDANASANQAPSAPLGGLTPTLAFMPVGKSWKPVYGVRVNF